MNRMTAQADAAVLQLGQDRMATIGDETRRMEELYMITAAINPIESEGVNEIAEALIDRFATMGEMGYLSYEDEVKMSLLNMKNKRRLLDLVQQVVSVQDLLSVCELVDQIGTTIPVPVHEYVVKLVRATRPQDDQFNLVHGKDAEKMLETIQYGPANRGIVWTMALAAANAVYNGQENVTEDHVKAVANDVIAHRIILTPVAASGRDKVDVRKKIVDPLKEKVKIRKSRLKK
jgi:MoxR-like ATPase